MKKLITLILICWVVSTLSNTVHAPLINGANAAEPYLFVSANDWDEGYLATLIDGRYLWVRGGVFEVPSEVSPALWNIIQSESGWHVGIINKSSGACGLGQSLPCSKMPEGCLGDYDCELNWTINYIKNRYETPEKAWEFWQKNHYY